MRLEVGWLHESHPDLDRRRDGDVPLMESGQQLSAASVGALAVDMGSFLILLSLGMWAAGASAP